MTREKWATLSYKEQRVKVAELCGWEWKEQNHIGSNLWCWHNGEHYVNAPLFPTPLCDKMDEEEVNSLPYYLSDLNACAEFEEVLYGPNYYRYYALLAQICVDDEYGHFASATAAQRAEAFVLTMEAE